METQAFRVSLQLAPGKSPHLYVPQIAELMKNDKSIHPMMERTLKMLKKTKTPFIYLARLREVVIDPSNYRHFERSAEPRGPWVCTLWSEGEVKEHLTDPEGHLKAVFNLFEKLGYEFYDSKPCTLEYMQMLEDITNKQIESQEEGRAQE